MERAIKNAVNKMPPRPVHLRAELLWAEHDGFGTTARSVRLYTELDRSTPSFTVTSYVPDGVARATVILLAAEECVSHEAKQLRDCGYAVFALKTEDVVSEGEAAVTDYEKAFMRGRAARKTSKLGILAWATLRVAEYVRKISDLSKEISIHDQLYAGSCAIAVARCDEDMRVLKANTCECEALQHASNEQAICIDAITT